MQDSTRGREVLPIPDRPYLGVRPFNAKDPAATADRRAQRAGRPD